MLRYFIFFIFCSFKLLSQDPDTLLNSILRIENDTEQVNQLYKQGFDLVDKDPKLAYAYAQNCERAALKSKSPQHISKSDNLSGILFYKQGNYKKALVYFEKYFAANKALNNILGLGYSCTNLANAYSKLKQLQKAENYYLQAINYYNTLNNKTEIANGLINLGVLKHEQKQLDAALENYEKALQTGKELNDYEIKAICLNNMAQIFSDKGNYEKALAYNYDAMELRELMGLDVDRTDSHLSIAEIALKQKNISLAEENLNLAIELCNELEYTEGKMLYYKLFSELQSQKNNYRSAYENLKLYTQLNDSLLLIQNREPESDFNVTGESNYNSASVPIRNLWLLILLLLFLIIIPFVLMRYKR
jgi:tetratricopeptide (TPR) repeat protein